MEIELYYTPRTRSVRTRWLLEELGAPYTLHPIDLFGGERNPVHPLGSVPAIRLDGETLIESGAICHWLADSFTEKNLAPAMTDPQRARYEQWMFFTPATLEPPAFDVLMHTQILPDDKRIDDIVPYATERYQQVLKVLAEELDHDGYLLGKTFTAADIMMATTLAWLPELLEAYPTLLAFTQRATSRPAYQRAIEPIEAAA